MGKRNDGLSCGTPFVCGLKIPVLGQPRWPADVTPKITTSARTAPPSLLAAIKKN